MWAEPCPGLPAGDLSGSTPIPGSLVGPWVRKGRTVSSGRPRTGSPSQTPRLTGGRLTQAATSPVKKL